MTEQPLHGETEFLATVGAYVRKQVDIAVKEQVAIAVNERLKEFKFLGEWDPNQVYRHLNMVALGGSVWFCVAEQTMRRPTTDEVLHWRLGSKRGRDGKDAPIPRSPSHR